MFRPLAVINNKVTEYDLVSNKPDDFGDVIGEGQTFTNHVLKRDVFHHFFSVNYTKHDWNEAIEFLVTENARNEFD